MCFSASQIKQSFEDYESERCSLIGDSFNMHSFVIFAWAACFGSLPRTSYVELCGRMGMAPGFVAPPGVPCLISRALVYGPIPRSLPSVCDLTRVMLTRVNHTGSDVRVTTGQVINPRAYPRQSASASWWEWRSVFHCRWQVREHINRLEMRSILLALKWRIRHQCEADCRFVHLTDSYVSMSVLSKGRSSSDMLMSVMRQIAAHILAFNLFPILVHVESTENPTDHGSRL